MARIYFYASYDTPQGTETLNQTNRSVGVGFPDTWQHRLGGKRLRTAFAYSSFQSKATPTSQSQVVTKPLEVVGSNNVVAFSWKHSEMPTVQVAAIQNLNCDTSIQPLKKVECNTLRVVQGGISDSEPNDELDPETEVADNSVSRISGFKVSVLNFYEFAQQGENGRTQTRPTNSANNRRTRLSGIGLVA